MMASMFSFPVTPLKMGEVIAKENSHIRNEAILSLFIFHRPEKIGFPSGDNKNNHMIHGSAVLCHTPN